ncbi:MAG: ThuA domain-containing protein, partial [Janthinobacterium lividum]
MKVVVLSGSGRYQDQWHDFTATSVEIERALSPLHLDVVVRATKPRSISELHDADLLVVNAGCGEFHESSDGPEEAWRDAFATLRGHVLEGRPVLALHAASNAFDGLADWHRWIGGRWDPDTSMHPPIGRARVEVTDPGHPITQGLKAFEVYDERYCGL